MSIVSVVELFDEGGASINAMFERTYLRVFDVVTSDPYVGAVAVRAAVDPSTGVAIPGVGASYNNGLLNTDPLYEFDHGAFVQGIRTDRRSDSNTAWKVSVDYGPFNTAVFGADPTLWPIRVSHDGERVDRVVDFDRNGDPIRNSAGDRFGDPITIDDHIKTMVIVRNELSSSYDPELASQFSDTINDAPWNGIAAGHCKMGIIKTSDPRWAPDAQVWYYEVTYPVQVSRTPWVKNLLDQGYNELVGSVPTPIMRGGQPISEPVALDGSGGELPPAGTPVTLTFDVYDEADWSGLNIDLSTRLGA